MKPALRCSSGPYVKDHLPVKNSLLRPQKDIVHIITVVFQRVGLVRPRLLHANAWSGGTILDMLLVTPPYTYNVHAFIELYP